MGIFSSYKTKSDEELMQLFQKGKERAFDELYHRYSKRILGFIYRMVNNEQKAQDLLHDLFLKIIEQPKAFNPEKAFKPWLFTVAANLCRNEFRKQDHQSLTEESQQQPEEEKYYEQLVSGIDHKVFQKHLEEEINQLKYEHKTTFILRFKEKLALKEIALIMECSEGTVKSRLFYTTKKLAEKLHVFNPANYN